MTTDVAKPDSDLDRAWVENHRPVIERAFAIFLDTGEWPKVTELRRHFAQRGPAIDIQAIADSKPRVPGEQRTLHQEFFTLQLRHLRYVPNAQPLLQVCISAIRRAVDAYLGPGDPQIRSDDAHIAPMAGGDKRLIDRTPTLLIAEHPGPLGSGGSSPEGWNYQANDDTILEFRDVHSIDGFLVAQKQTRAGWIQAGIPRLGVNLVGTMATDRHSLPGEPEAAGINALPDVLQMLRNQVQQVPRGEADGLDQWRQRSAALLRAALGRDHPLVTEFARVNYRPLLVSSNTGRETYDRARRGGLLRATAILEGACVELEVSSAISFHASKRDMTMASDIFVVHGHDTGALAQVARTVETLTASRPVILHEQPDKGRTIIEKFEGHAADAGFVVVLATGDDLGRAKGATEERPRARQNVILELGYFIGALGREKVAILYDDGVDLPSDMAGLLYILRDEGGAWKAKLAREMRAAGIDADANRL